MSSIAELIKPMNDSNRFSRWLISRRLVSAIAACEADLKKDPGNPRLLYLLARVLTYSGRVGEALPYIEKSSLPPEHQDLLKREITLNKQLVNSPKRELKIFTEREGGAQHSSFDNPANAGAYIADWVAETLGGRTSTQ